MKQPYTYLIGWTHHNLFYYGVRHANNCNPKELWIKYFTSSNIVKDCRKKFGEPDVIEVRKTFNDEQSALNWERKVLRRLNVLESKTWLNANIAGSFSFHTLPKTENHKIKISSALKGRINDWSIGNTYATSLKGKAKTKEHRQKISEGKTGKPRKDMIGNTYAKSLKGRLKDPSHQELITKKLNTKEVKDKISATWASKPIKKCPHCDVSGKGGNMIRYHFDNCKRKI